MANNTLNGSWQDKTDAGTGNVFSGLYEVTYKSRTGTSAYYQIRASIKSSLDNDRSYELYVKDIKGNWLLVASDNADHTITHTGGSYTTIANTDVEIKTETGSSGTWTGEIMYVARHPGSQFDSDSVVFNVNYPASSYYVTFHWNNNQYTPTMVSANYGDEVTLLQPGTAETTRYVGHRFLGWSRNKDATVPEYNSQDRYKVEYSVNLYAVWEEIIYTVTLDTVGGTSLSPITGKWEQTLSLPNAEGKAGHTFYGWSLQSGSITVHYQPGSSITINSDVTLYAVWYKNSYVVTFNWNNNKNVPTQVSAEYGRQVILTQPGIEESSQYAGHKFLGWSKNKYATLPEYYSQDRYTVESEVTFYAVWEEIIYTLTLDSAGGDQIGEIKGKWQQNILLPSAAGKAGYTFSGWSLQSGSSTADYQPGSSISITGNTTLHAVWTENTRYSVVFNTNGGTTASFTLTNPYGIVVDLPADPVKDLDTFQTKTTFNLMADDAEIPGRISNFISTGVMRSYTFKEWNSSADGKGTAMFTDGKVNFNHNVTVYAIWDIKYVGSIALPTAVRDQYTNVGWKKNLDDEEIIKDRYLPTGDITLYAVWEVDGLGGLIKFPSASDMNLSDGDRIRIVGSKSNDGMYTVGRSSWKNGTQTIEFYEDFVEADTQNASDFDLEIWDSGGYVPDFDYICSSNNRLYACSSKRRTIYASALGDPTDYWTFEGTNLDAYQVAVGSAGDFTGCIALNGCVLFFKEHVIHKLLGDYPAEYILYTYNNEGVLSTNAASLKDYTNSAIYVSEHGISMYNGSATSTISKELGIESKMKNGIAEICGEFYPLYYTDSNGGHTYVYDLYHGMWLEENYGGSVLAFAHLDGKNYALVNTGSSNKLYLLNSGTDIEDEWIITFKPFYEAISTTKSTNHIYEKKRYTHIVLRIELPKGSWMKAEISCDGSPWMKAGRIEGKENKVEDFMIRTPRCDKMQLRLSGQGAMTILNMDRHYTTGSRR